MGKFFLSMERKKKSGTPWIQGDQDRLVGEAEFGLLFHGINERREWASSPWVRHLLQGPWGRGRGVEDPRAEG